MRRPSSNRKLVQELFVFFITFLLVIVQVNSNSNKNAKEENDNHHRRLLLISLDGFRWDFLHGRAVTPTFDFIKTNGVHATEGIQNVFITNTLPNHFSMVTGLYVESHGMMDNFIFDSDLNDTYVSVFYEHDIENDPAFLYTVGEPVWTSHQIQNNGKTGVLMWMGGETAFRGIRPTKFFKHRYDLDEIKEMDMVVDWMTDKDEPIDFAVVYFPQPDYDGHIYGPESVEVTRKIEYLDKAMAHLLAELENRKLLEHTDIIVTSDHGFTEVSPDYLIRVDDILHPAWYNSPSYLPGSAMSIYPTEGMLDTVYAKLKSFSDKTGTFHVYKSRDIPERFHYKSHRRVPPIFAMAVLGYSFSTKDTLDGFKDLKGNHGYDNMHQQMRPFFLAYGPSFRKGFSVQTFESVDIYPLVCHIKGIRPFPNNGSMEVVSKLLRHYSNNQSDASTSSCDKTKTAGISDSCPRPYKEEEVPHV